MKLKKSDFNSFINDYWLKEYSHDERYLSQWMEAQVKNGMIENIDDYCFLRSIVDKHISNELSYHRLLCEKCNSIIGCTEEDIKSHSLELEADSVGVNDSQLDGDTLFSDFKMMSMVNFLNKYKAFGLKLPIENDGYIFNAFKPRNYSVQEQSLAIFVNTVGIKQIINNIPSDILLITVANAVFEAYKDKYMILYNKFLEQFNNGLTAFNEGKCKKYTVNKTLMSMIDAK